MEDLLALVFRVSIMYIYALTMLRLSGKRSVGELSPLDFVVATIIGDLFDDIFWSETPLSTVLVAFTTIIFLHMLVSYATYKSKRLQSLVQSDPVTVVDQGRLVLAGMRHERTPKETVYSEIRLQQEENLTEIRKASWEPSGRISVLKKKGAKPAQKQDLPRLKELYR